ncbi:MAG: RNA-directed DNA polymerase [Candidatus Falkowbacteria bacterium]
MDVFTYNNLYRAYLDCRKTKRKTANALKFEIDLEKNLERLFAELKFKIYRPGRSVCFVVTKPVPREIFAADFRDRIVHHLLIREIIKYGERNFIFDSYACREDKGTHKAIAKLKKFIRQITNLSASSQSSPRDCDEAEDASLQNGSTAPIAIGDYGAITRVFYAQLDIKGFFMAIDQRILYKLVEKLVEKQNRPRQWKQDVLWLAGVIIFHSHAENYITKGDRSLFNLIPPHKSLRCQPKGRGLPIGNYTSQFFANLYLNELDQFVKRELKCKHYIRYVDDFILLYADKEKLKYFKDRINYFLKEKLSLELNSNKIRIQSLGKGIDFLGYFIKSDYTLVRQKVVNRLKNKLSCVNFADVNSLNELEYLNKNLAMINSYYGHFKHAESFNLRKNIYNNHLGELKGAFLLKEGFVSLKIKRQNKKQPAWAGC